MVAVLFILTVGSGISVAGGVKDSSMNKECKRMCKQLKKEGWKVFFGSSTDLSTALESYYDSLTVGGSAVQSLISIGTATNVNMANTKAKARAAQEYASRLRSEVESATQIVTQSTQEGDDVTSRVEMENNLTVRVEQMVKGMSPVLTLRRDLDGKTEVQLFFILKHISLSDE